MLIKVAEWMQTIWIINLIDRSTNYVFYVSNSRKCAKLYCRRQLQTTKIINHTSVSKMTTTEPYFQI